MPKNTVTDPITDQEIVFARLVLSGVMTDRQAAEAAGLNPDTAAYTKAKPRVRDWMHEHHAALEQQLVQQAADLSRPAVEDQHHFNLGRGQVLKRLWELANMSPEMTRGSITGQVKAVAMIVAMENLIPDRCAARSENQSPATLPKAEIYQSEWLVEQQHAATGEPEPSPAAAQEENPPGDPEPGLAPAPAEQPLPDPGPTQPTFANRLNPADGQAAYVPASALVRDTRKPFSIQKNRFGPHR